MYYLQDKDFSIKKEGDRVVFDWKGVATIAYDADMTQQFLMDLVDTINQAANNEQGILLEIGMRTVCSVQFAKNVMEAVKAALDDIIH